ncbi:MAG: efflux RND transporter permease subunit [Candidatus Aminicenantes bacterium]|nr:efflux RND transporter permease subunit [Candidatus Aminicenantes bacterium]
MKIFVERPIATSMFFLAVLVLGVYSFLNIPFELAPKEDYPEVTINTQWRDVPPEIIQAQVTAPIEEIVSTVKGVKKIESQSHLGMSRIQIEFETKTNMEFATLSLREKIAQIKDELPREIQPPEVTPYIPEDFQTEAFLQYSISGDYSVQTLREMLKDKLEFGVGSIKGIALVRVMGGSEPVIQIHLREDRLKALNLQPFQVINRLQLGRGYFQTGKIKKGTREFIFKVDHPVKTMKDLSDMVVHNTGTHPVRLREVADIFPTYDDIYYLNRINGRPTLRLRIEKEKGISTLKIARKVKDKIEEIKQTLPSDLIFKAELDESEDILKNLRSLYLLVAIILTVIFVLIFIILRSLKPSLLILSSILFSVLITFNLIYFLKISLNMLTLGGLALGFGLFVDNSIVVFENVLRWREQGASPFKAAVEGAREVFLPVLASTLTTVSVFFTFAYFQGRLKIFYLPMAIVITSALTASLLVSFSLIPALSPRLFTRRKKEKKQNFQRGYGKMLHLFLKHPLIVILVIVALFYGSYKWFRSEVVMGDFLAWDYKQALNVSIGMPPGTEIETTDGVVKQFEAIILAKGYEKEIVTYVTPEQGYIHIEFPPEIENSFHPYVLKEELIQKATHFAGISLYVYGFDPQSYGVSMGSGTFYGSRIKFYGYNLKKLSQITTEVERTIRRSPRIKESKIISSSRSWYGSVESFQYVLKIDQEALQKYEIDPRYLEAYLMSMTPGRVIKRLITLEGREIYLSIKFPEAEDTDLNRLQNMLIKTPKGEFFRLGEISSVEEQPIAGSIDREDQRFQQTLMWDFRGPHKAAERYKDALFDSLTLPPGFSATKDIDMWRMTEEEKGQIKFAIIFSLVIIFMILASLYESFIQPFYILLAVPLALIGVFVAFVIADFPFDSSAYIGVILLGGIVVNNSILLVDHINLKRKQGLELLDSVLAGAKERIRPILMTSSTTILGMLPMVLIQIEVGRRQIWSSLALSTVGGLFTSTLFILIIIPVLYYHGSGILPWFQRKAAELKLLKEKL